MESKEQHLIRQYFILAMFFLFLAGCAHKRNLETTTYENWKTHLASKVFGK